MTIRTALELPLDQKLVDGDGNITQVWMQALGAIANAAALLRDAADLMDDLDSTATAAELGAGWETFRAKLQEIP